MYYTSEQLKELYAHMTGLYMSASADKPLLLSRMTLVQLSVEVLKECCYDFGAILKMAKDFQYDVDLNEPVSFPHFPAWFIAILCKEKGDLPLYINSECYVVKETVKWRLSNDL